MARIVPKTKSGSKSKKRSATASRKPDGAQNKSAKGPKGSSPKPPKKSSASRPPARTTKGRPVSSKSNPKAANSKAANKKSDASPKSSIAKNPGADAPNAKPTRSKREGKPGKIEKFSKSKTPAKNGEKGQNTPRFPIKFGKKKFLKSPSQPSRNAAKKSPIKKKRHISRKVELDLEVVAVGQTAQTPRRVLRPKFFPEIPTEKNWGHTPGTPETPMNYGVDRLVLMPKDPEWLFSYWELTAPKLENASHERLQNLDYQEALKLSWDSNHLFEPNYVFLPVEFKAQKWYLAVPGETQRSYRLEIGWLGENGHFISLLHSDPTGMPEKWSVTRERLMAEGNVLAYTARHSIQLGASDHVAFEASRGLFQLENLSSGLFSSSSLALAQKQPSQTQTTEHVARKTRIQVTGTVPKGSTVRLAGKNFAPDKRGRFKATVETVDPTLHLEVVSTDGAERFFAYDLSAPAT